MSGRSRVNETSATGLFARAIAWLNTRCRVSRRLLCLFRGGALVYAGIPIANALLKESIKDYELVARHRPARAQRRGDLSASHEEVSVHVSAAVRDLPRADQPARSDRRRRRGRDRERGCVARRAFFYRCGWRRGGWERRHVLLYVIPSVVISVYAWSNFHIGQPSLILLALMLGAFVALQQKRGVLAGALIGVAAAIKAFPVIAIVYLVYRRFWLAAASLIATIVLLFIAAADSGPRVRIRRAPS